MQGERIYPKVIEFKDSVQELYPYATPGQWQGEPIYHNCVLGNTENYREIMSSILNTLIWLDKQCRYKFTESHHSYSISDIRTFEIYKNDEFKQVIAYRVFAVSDLMNRGFYCFTDYCDFNFRPLFKDYEMFIIDRMLLDDCVQKKEYFRSPFLLAVQRSVYLWLIECIGSFELKGSIGMPVRWAHSKQNKDHYDFYSAFVYMEFDMCECYRNGSSITSMIDIKLSLPFDFKRDKIDKRNFKDDDDFYDQMWDGRRLEIFKLLGEKYGLKCNEDISDIKSPERNE
jgi:hypothetical protein